MQNLAHRLPPQNIEYEQAVLGSALMNDDCAFHVVSHLKVLDFYKPAHQGIFAAVKALHEEGDNIDIVSVTNKLETHGNLGLCGGAAYVSFLSDCIPSISGVRTGSKIIKHKADLRAAISMAQEITEKCYNDNGDSPSEMTEELEKIVYESSVRRKSEGFKHIGEVIGSVMSQIEKLASGEIKALGMETGYDDLDFILTGLKPSDLIIVAGRPSMGKTALAMNIIENAAKAGNNQAIFSLEMNDESLVFRAISSISKIDSFKIRNGKLNKEEIEQVRAACRILANMGIFIDDSAGLSPYDIRSRARRIKEKYDIKAIWIDYLQLSHTKARSKEEETSIISRELKAMAKELKVPVIALSQLNRGCESRTDKRPLLSDLRDSGAIEQDADVVAFVYRDEVYNDSEHNPLKGIAEILIRKHRNGPTGSVDLIWKGGLTRFESKMTMHRPVR